MFTIQTTALIQGSGCRESTRPVSGRVKCAELSAVVKCDGRLIWGSVSEFVNSSRSLLPCNKKRKELYYAENEQEKKTGMGAVPERAWSHNLQWIVSAMLLRLQAELPCNSDWMSEISIEAVECGEIESNCVKKKSFNETIKLRNFIKAYRFKM